MKRGFESVPKTVFLPLLRRYLEILKAHLGEDLIAVILYGSLARGEAELHKSDIDLYVVASYWPCFFNHRFEILEGVFKELEATKEYRDALSKELHVSFSEYPLTIEEALRHGPLDLEVYADGIVLYDREGFADRKFSELELRLNRIGAQQKDVGKRKRLWILKPKVEFGEVIEI
ncbi:MAG: Nucleotidyltransferase domain protein [Candidatus Bathyarchaeota archaeon BA2]|nr:MAG: Nucleotidyltransferase domain protein [Candidatus Bathyarchaeota archaeon BA2]